MFKIRHCFRDTCHHIALCVTVHSRVSWGCLLNIIFGLRSLSENKWGWIKWLTPLPLEREVKGSILTPHKAGGPFLPLVEPEASSLPLVGVGLSTSQPPP